MEKLFYRVTPHDMSRSNTELRIELVRMEKRGYCTLYGKFHGVLSMAFMERNLRRNLEPITLLKKLLFSEANRLDKVRQYEIKCPP